MLFPWAEKRGHGVTEPDAWVISRHHEETGVVRKVIPGSVVWPV